MYSQVDELFDALNAGCPGHIIATSPAAARRATAIHTVKMTVAIALLLSAQHENVT